jgi:hypothetical protein
MSYHNLNSYCSPKPYTVVENVKPVATGLTLNYIRQDNTVLTQSPEVFGPAFWFSFHTGAAHLPDTLSPISASRIRSFIRGIPELVPCTECSEHSRAFIEENKARIDNFARGDDVFKFYVDFHNYINRRLNKPLVSYEKAYEMYKGGKNVVLLKKY